MSATMTRRKPTWTLDEWRAFGLRCQALRDRIDTFITTFPPTVGITVRHAKPIFRAIDALTIAMIRTERVMERQHPESDVMAAIHGPKGTRLLLGPIKVIRGEEKLSRERWAALASALEAMQAEAEQLMVDLASTRCAKPAEWYRFELVEIALGDARYQIESRCSWQHP